MQFFTLPFTWTADLIRRSLRLIEKPTETLKQISPDNQLAEPSPDMVHKRQNEDIVHLPDGSSKRVKRLPTKATAHGHGREDQSASRSQQVARLKDLENDNRRLSDAHQDVLAELRETHSTCEKQQQEISFLREKLRESSALLDIRNQELKVAKTFLSKEDPLSTSDIVQSVRDLNSEIMQIATHLADNLVLVRKHPAGNVPEGPCKPVFAALIWPRRPWDEVDEGSLELALQGFLVIWVSFIVNAWGFGEASGWCDQMYSKVRETEEPTVASNWRALTRRTLYNMDLSRSDLPSQIVNGAIEQLAFLLSSCGAGGFDENAYDIHKLAAGKLASLFFAARKLNKVVGENVVSGDLVVTIISGRCPFDADYMEAPYARGGAKPGQGYVICTTDLGLCERKGTKAEKILLKPKVTLDGF